MKTKSIVLLHGWGLSGNRFAVLVGLLEKRGYRVWAPDMPGFGACPPPPRVFTLTDYVDFVHDFLKKHRIVRPIFIGHSFGGRVSLKYAELYPSELSALILTGTPGFTPVAKKKLVVFVALAKIGNFFFSIPPLSLFQEQVRRWYYYVVGARDFYRARGVMRDIFKKIVQEDLVASMQAVTVPTLLVWGADDIIVPRSVAQRMLEHISGATLKILPGADHGVPYKDPDVFVATIDSFLQSV